MTATPPPFRSIVTAAGPLLLGWPLFLVPNGCGDTGSDTAGDPTVATTTTGTSGCPSGEADCGSGCVDLQTNLAHCGSCNHGCADGEECNWGSCGAPCDDECAPAGRQCSEGDIRECGELDGTDNCLEWGAIEACETGFVCDPTTLTCREPCGDYCEPFSIILLPDTQYYTTKQGDDADNTYFKQAQWIIDHRDSDNIQFVIHLGDVTDDNYSLAHGDPQGQWEIADKAHGMLDDAGVPYSIVPGNHDYRVGGSFDRGGSLFDDFFGRDRFEGKSWYGGAYGGGNANTNNYTFIELGPMRFMVVSLEYAPRKDVLCWAEQVIADHPEHRVIIATHCYKGHGEGPTSGCPEEEYATLGASGQAIWHEIVERHSNVFLVVSGHINDSAYHDAPGNLGNTVHQLVVDYQMEASCTDESPATCNDNCRGGNYTGNGWLRKLTFDPRANYVYAETITVEEGNENVFPNGEPVLFCSSLYHQVAGDAYPGGVWYDQSPTHTDHLFEFPYDMTTPLAYARDDAGRLGFNDRSVNSAGAGEQRQPQIAMSPTGAFVVVWEDDSSGADGAGNFDIMARGFAPGGCESFDDIVVNATTAGHQQSPVVAMDDNGNFVVVWADDQDDNGVYQIHGRGFGPDGSERIATFTVNSVADGQQTRPAVAMAPDGRFVVAWEDDPGAGADRQIWLRGFTAAGAERLSDRSAHSDALGERIEPAVGIDANANFVVAWQDDSDGNGTYQIHARGFNADGSQQFARLTVNTVDDGQQRDPAVGMSAAGAFVVAWEDHRDAAADYRIYARRFAAGGVAGTELMASSDPDGLHLDPDVSMAADGSCAITWSDDSNANGSFQVRGRSFDPTGADWLAERVVNREPDGEQAGSAVALNADGTLVVVWEDDMDGNGSYQILAAGLESP